MKLLFTKGLVQMNEDIYGIKKWGDDILEIIENGNIVLKIILSQNPPVDLIKVIQSRGINCPVLLRLQII